LRSHQPWHLIEHNRTCHDSINENNETSRDAPKLDFHKRGIVFIRRIIVHRAAPSRRRFCLSSSSLRLRSWRRWFGAQAPFFPPNKIVAAAATHRHAAVRTSRIIAHRTILHVIDFAGGLAGRLDIGADFDGQRRLFWTQRGRRLRRTLLKLSR
jgi:hypothetical protein